uniref:Putative secreted protein n=1 Tax=Anopheles darlingi TaxID=43151 RepID=A0A2M4D9Z8_ANODA
MGRAYARSAKATAAATIPVLALCVCVCRENCRRGITKQTNRGKRLEGIIKERKKKIQITQPLTYALETLVILMIRVIK